MAVTEEEITAGLVVHVNPALLIEQGGCETMALANHILSGEHYFLVLEKDVSSNKMLCMPLHSPGVRRNPNDWVELDIQLKSGKFERWRDQSSHYFKWAFWRVPAASFTAASAKDDSDGDRRWYGKDNDSALLSVKLNLLRARNPWRSLI